MNPIISFLRNLFGVGPISKKTPMPTATPQPTPTLEELSDQYFADRGFTKKSNGRWSTQAGNAPQPTATPMPTARPIAQTASMPVDPNRRLAVEEYIGKSSAPIPLPPQQYQDLLWEYMPNEATQAAVAMAGENEKWDPYAINARNNDGTIDYGLMQNNSKTMLEMLGKNKYARQLHDAGIYKPEDVVGDALKSIIASKITRQYEDDGHAAPWSWWYGWQNKGYNIDPSRPIEDVAGQRYPSGKLPYFKLQEYLQRTQ